MQKYIFLDIDGVLSPDNKKQQHNFDVEKLWKLIREYQEHKNTKAIDYLEKIICQEKVERLRNLLEKYDSKLIIHSSWMYFPGEEATLELLKKFNLDTHLADNWSTATKEHRSKNDNIQDYIHKNDVVEYIVIDDEFISEDLIKRQIMPRTNKGLNTRHFNIIERFLKIKDSFK